MKKTVFKGIGLALAMLFSALVGFMFGIDHAWQHAERHTTLQIRNALLEGYNDKRTFSLAGMEELMFHPWAKAERPRLTLAGAGDQGMRKVIRR